jgi:transposase
LYAERDEEKRAAYLAEIQSLDPRKIVYVDESGVEDTLFRDYARAPRGCKVLADIKGKKSQRISLICGLLGKKMIAPLAFEGYTNADVFNQWLAECLLAELPPGHTVIIDNARFHHSAKTRELIESAGCNLIFLPPYSPDFNDIEPWWAILKKHLRKILPDVDELSTAIDQAFANMNYHKLKST